MIVEEEQHGANRAAYGTQLLKELSAFLSKNFGKGFSVGNLKNIRQFYKVYSEDQIGETVFSQFANFPTVSTGRKFYLSWSHYLKLMRIDNIEERHFLLELGTGFTFVGRQERFTFDEEHFKAISGDNVVYDVVDSYETLLNKVMK